MARSYGRRSQTEALHAIERAALDHVDGASASDMLCLLADALGRTQIVMTATRGEEAAALLDETAYVDPDLLAVARDVYNTPDNNPLFKALPRMTPDRLTHFTTHTTWGDILGSAFYADYWEPTGVWHAGNFLVRFTSNWGLVFAFGCARGREWFDEEETRLAAEGARAVARGVRLRTEIDDARAVADIVGDPGRVLLLMDSSGTILMGPDGAKAILTDLGLHLSRSRRLVAGDAAARQRLERALRTALVGGCDRFVLTTPRHALVNVSPGPRYRHRQTAFVSIDLLHDAGWTAGMLAAAFGLTPREGEVVSRLCAGRSTEEIGHDLGLAVGSVRLYLKRAMSKIGVHSQAQLVAKVLRG